MKEAEKEMEERITVKQAWVKGNDPPVSARNSNLLQQEEFDGSSESSVTSDASESEGSEPKVNPETPQSTGQAKSSGKRVEEPLKPKKKGAAPSELKKKKSDKAAKTPRSKAPTPASKRQRIELIPPSDLGPAIVGKGVNWFDSQFDYPQGGFVKCQVLAYSKLQKKVCH